MIGIENFCKNGKCSNCGACCADMLPLTSEDIENIKNYVKEKGIGPFPISEDDPLRCPFRDEKNRRCSIYEKRPTICRKFICCDNKLKPMFGCKIKSLRMAIFNDDAQQKLLIDIFGDFLR